MANNVALNLGLAKVSLSEHNNLGLGETKPNSR